MVIKISSIREIRSIADLNALFENKDFNGTGCLSVKEYGSEEILLHDKDGDKLLSPWEILYSPTITFAQPGIFKMEDLDAKKKSHIAIHGSIEGFENRGDFEAMLDAKELIRYDGIIFDGYNLKAKPSHFSNLYLKIKGDKIVEAYNPAGKISLTGGRLSFTHLNDGRFWGTFLEDTWFQLGGNWYLFKAGSSIPFSKKKRMELSPSTNDTERHPLKRALDQFNFLFPGIGLSGDFDSEDIYRICSLLTKLSPNLLRNIGLIRLEYKKDPTTDKRNCHDPISCDAALVAHSPVGIIHIWKEKFSRVPSSKLAHEAAHLLSRKLQREDSDLFEVWGSVAKADKIYSYTRKKWSKPDSKGNIDGPRYGFVKAIGSMNIAEDIATHVELIYADSWSYKQLIDSDSDFYKEHPEQRKYSVIYRRKLKLLYKYGLITKEQYLEIDPSDPRPFLTCQQVNCY